MRNPIFVHGKGCHLSSVCRSKEESLEEMRQGQHEIGREKYLCEKPNNCCAAQAYCRIFGSSAIPPEDSALLYSHTALDVQERL